MPYFSSIGYLNKVKKARTDWEALKREFNRLLAISRMDPNLSQEDRETIQEDLKQGAQLIDSALQDLERGYHRG